MCKALDLTGRKFGKLTVIKREGNTNHHRTVWLCQCDCGKMTVRVGSVLTSGRSKSCGCFRKVASKSSQRVAARSTYKPANRTVQGIICYCIYKDLRDEYREYLDGDSIDSYYGTIYTWDVPKLNKLTNEQQEALLDSLRTNSWEGDGSGRGRR